MAKLELLLKKRKARQRLANKAIMENGRPKLAKVYFKFTCPKCGARCEFEEPNKLYEKGICYKCGADEPVTHAGFNLEHIPT